MVLEGPPVNRYEVQILTPHFQFSGQLETVGAVGNFINDPSRTSLSLYDVNLTPLTSNNPLKGLSRPHIVIRRSRIVLLYFVSTEARDSIRTLPRRELLVAYTPVAVCRAYFHMTAEANVENFLGVVSGELLPVTDANVFPLREYSAPFPRQPGLILIGRSHLQFYHAA
jgi:hypothetical protein